MSSDQTVRVNIDEKKIGRAAGNAISTEISSLESEIQQTNQAVKQLSNDVQRLEERISEVERAKAEAERRAIEDLKDRLKEQVEEKRREYERRIGEVLDDYRGSIERLKDRFLGSITGHGENFETVEEEFSDVLEARSTVVEQTRTLEEGATTTYGERTDAVLSSRNAFFEHIDGFLEDREETAATIDSLQTDVSGVDGAATVTVPFWVVGIETGSGEEIRVLPVVDRGDPDGSPTRRNPYADYLRAHPTHGYTDMVEAVRSYVVRDEVRDALASRGGAYADPEFLAREGLVQDRFVDALRRYELDGNGGTPEPEPEENAPKPTPEPEVSADG
jgi:outer membrane murein-binding lipoprotein Lpp